MGTCTLLAAEAEVAAPPELAEGEVSAWLDRAI